MGSTRGLLDLGDFGEGEREIAGGEIQFTLALFLNDDASSVLGCICRWSN